MKAVVVIVGALLMGGAALADHDESGPGDDAGEMWTPGAEEVWAPPAEPEDGASPEAGTTDAPLLDITLTGYADLRFAYSHLDVNGLIPTDDFPALHPLLDANAQIRWRWGERGFLSADVSAIYQRGVLFFGDDWREVPDHDVATYRPFVSLNELYTSLNLHEHLNVTVGRKRVVWGSGFALNPSDILNPPKDPTDPTAQRAGAWLAMVEAPFEYFTISALVAPQVTRQTAGFPTAFVVQPDFPTAEQAQAGTPYTPDKQAHWAFMLRGYALLWDTDINLIYAYSNLFNDAFVDHSRLTLSLSRYVTDSLELHVEATGELGSTRRYLDRACLDDLTAVFTCAATGVDVAATSHTDDGRFRPKVVAGGRYTFADDSLLSAEYYYAGDGYGPRQYAAYVQALTLMRDAQRQGLLPDGAPSLLAPSSSADASVPQRFAFNPLRRHYLFVSYTKPRLFDDFTIATTLILNLEDLSGQLAPSITWSPEEWLLLGAYGFITLPGFGDLAPSYRGGRGVPEMDLAPMEWRALLSAKVFY